MPDEPENFADDQIAHYKALRDHYEKEALQTAFNNRQLVKQNTRLQQRIEELEEQLIEPTFIPPADQPTPEKVVKIPKQKGE